MKRNGAICAAVLTLVLIQILVSLFMGSWESKEDTMHPKHLVGVKVSKENNNPRIQTRRPGLQPTKNRSNVVDSVILSSSNISKRDYSDSKTSRGEGKQSIKTQNETMRVNPKNETTPSDYEGNRTVEAPLRIKLPADAAAQSHLPAHPTAVVCAIQRNEAHYLQEFIDYHLGLGFSEIVIFDNSDDFELQSWQDTMPGVTILHLNSSKPMQRHAYSLCIRRTRQTHTWIAMMDIDERLVLKKHNNVVDFAREYCPRHHLAINWRFFGFSGQEKHLELPLVLRFQCRAFDGYARNSMVKPFAYLPDVHQDAIVKSPHRLHRTPGAVEMDTSGKIISSGEHPGRAFHANGATDVAVIYHYKYKSREEYIAKCQRGSAISGHAFSDSRLQNALQGLDNRGKPIPLDTIFDDRAWKTLRRVAPKYAALEVNPLFAEARRNWTCVNGTN